MTLERQLAAFNHSRGVLLDELDAFDPAVLAAKPVPGKWSIMEIVEHLAVAERAVFMGLPDPSRLVAMRRTLKHRALYRLVIFILSNGIRVKVPSPTMVPQGNRSLSEIRRLWDENHAWLRACITHLGPAGISNAVFDHPVTGPLTVGLAVHMGAVHVRGHVRQIRTLQRLLS